MTSRQRLPPAWDFHKLAKYQVIKFILQVAVVVQQLQQLLAKVASVEAARQSSEIILASQVE
jgi:hypothetical protein